MAEHTSPQMAEGGSQRAVEQGSEPSLQKKSRDPLAQTLRMYLVRYPKTLVVVWGVVAALFVLLLPIAYYSWYDLPQRLWDFANEEKWRWIPSFFGFFFLFAAPFWATGLAVGVAGFVADISFEIQDSAIQRVKESVRETEQDAIDRLEQSDTAGLLPLLRYSRAQLDAYYEIGLKQTRGSFFNAVLAMWLGFLLLLIGIALYVGPVERLNLTRPPQDFNILILSGAAIVEFISALFLWVYRSTIAQLTYYYRLQMHNHTSILCFRMASTMAQPDETKRLIIEKILEWSTLPERLPLTGAKGFRTLLQPRGARNSESGE